MKTEKGYTFMQAFWQVFCVALLTLPIIPGLIFWLNEETRFIFYDLRVILSLVFFILIASLWLSWIAWRGQGAKRK